MESDASILVVAIQRYIVSKGRDADALATVSEIERIFHAAERMGLTTPENVESLGFDVYSFLVGALAPQTIKAALAQIRLDRRAHVVDQLLAAAAA